MITHLDGYAHIEATAETFPGIIKLEPWATVEGTFRVGREPAARVTLSLSPSGLNSYGRDLPHIYASYESPTDQSGRFVFNRVVPGPARIGRHILLMVNEGANKLPRSMTPVDLPAGKTTQLELADGLFRHGPTPTPGRSQRESRMDVRDSTCRAGSADLPMPDAPPIPQEIQADFAKRQQWMLQWQPTPAGRAWTAWLAGALGSGVSKQSTHTIGRPSIARGGELRGPASRGLSDVRLFQPRQTRRQTERLPLHNPADGCTAH